MSKKKCDFFDVWPEEYNERFECDIPINDVMDWIKNHFEPSDKVTEHTSYTYKRNGRGFDGIHFQLRFQNVYVTGRF